MITQSIMLNDNQAIYFDNAATSFPKPEEVIQAVNDYMINIGANPGRSGHRMAVQAGKIVFKARKTIALFFGVKNPMHVIFTCNATEALNLAIKGIIRKGDHVITTSMEHNSTIRPLKNLEENGLITLTILQCDNKGQIRNLQLEKAITPKTRCLVINHASNVIGSVQPIKEIGKICKTKGIYLIADCAQSAGVVPINIKLDNIDILCFAGHKGLYGPTGTGGMILADSFDFRKLHPLKQGGTGSLSDKPIQPDFLPDCFESGTLNVAGISGLLKGVKFVQSFDSKGKDMLQHKMKLVRYFIDNCQKKIPEFECYSYENQINTGVVSFRLRNISVSEASQILSEKYNIMCRQGLHCSPLAHQTIKTFPEGTLRFGFSVFNTIKEIDLAIDALKSIADSKKGL